MSEHEHLDAEERISRRAFLKRVGISGLALAGLGGARTSALAAGPLPKSIVVVAKSKKLFAQGDHLQTQVARDLLDAALAKVTGESTAQAAWKALFSSSDRVGVKVNCLAGRPLSPHVELVEAIVGGLRSAGVAGDHIFVWERLSRELAASGFPTKATGGKYRCVATDGRYAPDLIMQGVVGSRFTPIVTKYCTALINVPVLKDHDLAGVTIALKNNFGAIHNPNKYHGIRLHDGIADVNAVPQIRKRTRLVICDASRVVYNGGPGFKPQFTERCNAILVSRDPVALDYVGWQTIEELRKAHGLPSLAAIGKEPTHIAKAAGPGRQLGTNEPSRIEQVSLEV